MLLKPCTAAGLDDMSYSDITAMLASSAAPQPHHLGTAQETPTPLPIPNSPLANHPHNAQSSCSHKDMRLSSQSMSIGSSHESDPCVSAVSASAVHSSSSGSNSQTDISLQEAATDASLQEADTDASLQEADTDAESTCEPAQAQPAAIAETIAVQSIGASDQHYACQIPFDVHSGRRHPSAVDVHDVLHLLAGAQSSDDLSMQQLQTLAGMDAQSSDGITTLYDSPPGSVSSLGIHDRLPSFAQAAAMQRPGAGHIYGNAMLGLSDLSAEATVSRLQAEETESMPEEQRAGSAHGTATPVVDEMLMQQTSYEVS